MIRISAFCSVRYLFSDMPSSAASDQAENASAWLIISAVSAGGGGAVIAVVGIALSNWRELSSGGDEGIAASSSTPSAAKRGAGALLVRFIVEKSSAVCVRDD